jgi:Asp-tRNA(Asn)/Glu-tRNA(Gln) amidotransferase A subunit family amidase
MLIHIFNLNFSIVGFSKSNIFKNYEISLSCNIKNLIKLYKKKEISPYEVANDIINNIKENNEKINGFTYIENFEKILIEAKKSEKRYLNNDTKGRLDGIFYSIKDLLKVKNLPTKFGSKLKEFNNNELDDSPVNKKILQEGGIFIGSKYSNYKGKQQHLNLVKFLNL